MENWRRRRAEGPVGAIVVRGAVKPVRAAGVRRMGWKREVGLIAVVAMEGRWMIVRRVRRVREEIRGGILALFRGVRRYRLLGWIGGRVEMR